MEKIDIRETVDQERRRFFGAAALTLAAAELGGIGSTQAQTKPAPRATIKPGTNTFFVPLKQPNRNVLRISPCSSTSRA